MQPLKFASTIGKCRGLPREIRFFSYLSRKMPKNKKKEVLEKMKSWTFSPVTGTETYWQRISFPFYLYVSSNITAGLLFLSVSLLWNAGIASSCKHEYFCIATDSQSSSAFPTYQKVFLQGSLFEMDWNEIYSFFLFWTIMTSCFHTRMF